MSDSKATLLPWQEEYFADKTEEFKHRSLAQMTHGIGERYPRLYGVWQSMRSRCNNPNRAKYPMYGGRGIFVCDEWNNSVEAFAEWALSEGYAEGLQLDRIDNDGPYCPENCRWVTRKENCRNTRRNKYLTLCGIRKTVAEWCETLDISEYTLYYWIREHGEKGCEKRVYERLASSLWLSVLRGRSEHAGKTTRHRHSIQRRMQRRRVPRLHRLELVIQNRSRSNRSLEHPRRADVRDGIRRSGLHRD